jgi:hypothetical protein
MATMEFPKKAGSTQEFLVCTTLLPAMGARYDSTFALLEIPEVLRSDRNDGEHGTIYFRDYDGEKYNHRWNEGNGGAPLGTELSSEMVQLLKDFQQIDVEWLLSLHAVGESVEKSAFDLQDWLLSFQKRKTLAVSIGISDDQFTQAAEFINGGFQLKCRIVNNGDFYPRNLVKLPHRMVVVDWGYWTGYRACFVDYLVNVAAFAYIHMWGNGPWQHEFAHDLTETFEITSDDLRKAILIKSFEQAIYWRGDPQLVQARVNQFKMALKNTIAS